MDQRELDGLLAQVIGQARRAGVPVAADIDPHVAVNRRAVGRLGRCRVQGGRYAVEVAAWLAEGEERALLLQTLAHEVLHTCPGCANHGPRWRKWAKRMEEAWGYHITRTTSLEELGVADPRPARYVLACQRCGALLRRMRRSPLVDHPERYRCRCGGELRLVQRPEGEK